MAITIAVATTMIITLRIYSPGLRPLGEDFLSLECLFAQEEKAGIGGQDGSRNDQKNRDIQRNSSDFSGHINGGQRHNYQYALNLGRAGLPGISHLQFP
jgi:hypothetical protein